MIQDLVTKVETMKALKQSINMHLDDKNACTCTVYP